MSAAIGNAWLILLPILQCGVTDHERRHTATNRKTKTSAMKGLVTDIEELTEENSDFRRVLYTGKACASG